MRKLREGPFLVSAFPPSEGLSIILGVMSGGFTTVIGYWMGFLGDVSGLGLIWPRDGLFLPAD